VERGATISSAANPMTAIHDGGRGARPGAWFDRLKRARFVLIVAAAVFAVLWESGALATQPAGQRALGDEMRSVALQNLGVAELWSSRLDDARRDLEQGLALARRARRPWLEIPCLAHLGIAGPLTGLSLSAGLEFSQEAVRIVDAHGWCDADGKSADRHHAARRQEAAAGTGGWVKPSSERLKSAVPRSTRSAEQLPENRGRPGRYRLVRIEVCTYLQGRVGRFHSDNVREAAKVVNITSPRRECLHREDVIW